MKIIFFGLGSIGQRHLQNVVKLYPEAKIYCYKQSKNTFLIKNGKKFNKVNILKKYNITQIKSLIEIKKIKFNYAFITNPSSMHLKYAIFLAKLGINIFIEKPLSNSTSNVNKLKKIFKEKRNKCMVGFNLRFNDCYKYIKKKLQINFFGKIYKVDIFNGEYLPNYHNYENYKNTYAAKKKLGGGVLLTQIHELDLILSLFGKPKKIISHVCKLSNLKIDVEDNVDIIMAYRNKFIVNLHMDYFTKPSIRYFKIFGTKKDLYWDYHKNSITIFNKKNLLEQKVKFKKFNRNDMYVSEIKSFFNPKINSNNLPNLQTGIDTLKLALQIKKGSKF